KSAVPLAVAVILLGAVTLGGGAYIAYAGGRVRHREFRNEPPPPKRPEHEHDKSDVIGQARACRFHFPMGKRSACHTIRFVASNLDRAERSVEEQSVALKKPLGLGDLVLTQIVFVVVSSWVGTAAKLGTSHLFFWVLAILLFYIPQAAVVIYLSRLMPLEGGIYQWA